jgi:hypothetical protein
VNADQGTLLTPNPLARAWGRRRIVQIAKPAAGKDFTFTTSESMLWGIVSLTTKLVTSAQVAKRVPALEIKDGDGNPLMVIAGSQELAESSTRRITFAQGVASNSTLAGAGDTIGLPRMLLLPGYSVATVTTGVQTEDQYESTFLWIEEFEQEQRHPLAEIVAEVHQILLLERAAEYAAS